VGTGFGFFDHSIREEGFEEISAAIFWCSEQKPRKKMSRAGKIHPVLPKKEWCVYPNAENSPCFSDFPKSRI
jgi:hypothetical protein